MLKMLSDFVLVMVDKVEEKTSGGLYLTASTAEKPHTGLVVAVGPGKRSSTGELIEHGIAAGDELNPLRTDEAATAAIAAKTGAA